MERLYLGVGRIELRRVHPHSTEGRCSARRQASRGRVAKTIYIELIVNGDVVDLDRIELPPDTPIIDKRFTKDDQKCRTKNEMIR